MKHTFEEIQKLCWEIKERYPDLYLYKGYDLAKIATELLDEAEKAYAQRDQAIAALKTAKKTLKKALKTINQQEEHNPEDCRYYTTNAYLKCGGCLGTKEIDPCEGKNCPNWKPTEEHK